VYYLYIRYIKRGFNMVLVRYSYYSDCIGQIHRVTTLYRSDTLIAIIYTYTE